MKSYTIVFPRLHNSRVNCMADNVSIALAKAKSMISNLTGHETLERIAADRGTSTHALFNGSHVTVRRGHHV